MDRLKAILFLECLWRHVSGGGLPHAGGHQLYGGVLVHQLEGVLVAGDDDGLPALPLVDGGNGADEVVGLPAGKLIAGNVHGVQHLPDNGKLGGQVLGHGLALRLILSIGQVAEGRRLQVKGTAQGVGVFLLHQLEQNIEKTEDGVGGSPIPGGQGANAVKGPVQDGVAVNDHQLHGEILLENK